MISCTARRVAFNIHEQHAYSHLGDTTSKWTRTLLMLLGVGLALTSTAHIRDAFMNMQQPKLCDCGSITSTVSVDADADAVCLPSPFVVRHPLCSRYPRNAACGGHEDMDMR